MTRADDSESPTDPASKNPDASAFDDLAHAIYMTLERAAAIARMLAVALYHNTDSGRVEDARLGCEGIAELLDGAADRACKLYEALESK